VLPGLNLDDDDNSVLETHYSSVFMANHKNGVLAASFSADGLYLCTSSTDCSIKLLDVGKMKAVGMNDAAAAQARPTLRSFYDHLEAVNDVVFHPHSTLIASASDDCTVRLFDIVGSGRRAFRTLSDVARVLSVSFHPSGDYLLASTTGRVVRLYDVASGACFKSRDEAAQHAGGVLSASWSLDGTLFATAGEDGDVKLWDGVSQKMTRAFPRLNHGCAMLSARFSRNTHYLLATGADGVASLIDVRTNQVLRTVGDATSAAARQAVTSNRGAAFSCDEKLILLPSAQSPTLSVYSSRDGRLLDQLRGHNAPINAVTASPTESLLVTAGLDSRARLWVAGKS
jgi:cleavage stimulation factor subunit 1